MSSPYLLTCLLCAEAQPHPVRATLVALQEHAMEEHGVTREHLAQTTSQKQEASATMIWTYTLPEPDGRPWLRAEKLRGLVGTGIRAGYTARALAAACDLSFVILAMLDEAAIEAESLPAGLLEHMATVLGVSEQLLLAYLSAPIHPIAFPHGSGSWKKLTFGAMSGELTPAQRQRWLGLTTS
jgi:hypothetical protein